MRSENTLVVKGPIDSLEALAIHKELHAFGFVWQPAPDHRIIVSGQYYATAEEAKTAKWQALEKMHYQPPRWWQWWRWGERRP